VLGAALIRWFTCVIGGVFLLAYFGMQVTGGRQKLQQLGYPVLAVVLVVLTTIMFLGSLLRWRVGWYAALGFALVNLGDTVLRMLRQRQTTVRGYLAPLTFVVLYSTYFALLWTQVGRLAFRK